MALALRLAARAGRMGEVPVGAVVVDPAGRVIAAEHNRPIGSCDPTAHAEMLAMRKAAAAMGNYRLVGCSVYVTLEPCPMCAGALCWARVERVVFATADPRWGAMGSVINIPAGPAVNHRPRVEGGLMAEEAARLLKEFFAARR